jgi:regulator of sirC expression with transglutaminase-like and TPR domain
MTTSLKEEPLKAPSALPAILVLDCIVPFLLSLQQQQQHQESQQDKDDDIVMMNTNHQCVGRLALTCREYYHVWKSNHALWKSLANARWKFAPTFQIISKTKRRTNEEEEYGKIDPFDYNNNNDGCYSMEGFANRCLLDRRMEILVQTMAGQMHLLDHYGLEHGIHWGSSFWKKIVQTLQQQQKTDDYDEHDNYALGIDVLVRMTRYNKKKKQNSLLQAEDDRLVACVAWHCLDAVYFAILQQEWIQILSTTTATTPYDYDCESLEQGMIVLSQFILVAENPDQEDPFWKYEMDNFAKCQNIPNQLDQIAAEFQQELPRIADEQQQLLVGVDRIIWIVRMIDQFLKTKHWIGIVGDLHVDPPHSFSPDDYYDARNSSIHHVLRNHIIVGSQQNHHNTYYKGNPITLAILYKLILRRMHIESHIIGCPGHALLGLSPTATASNTQWYFDVYHGRFMTGTDLMEEHARNWRQSMGVPWSPRFLLPMDRTAIWMRMLHNLRISYFRQFQQQRTIAPGRLPSAVRSLVVLERIYVMLSMTTSISSKSSIEMHSKKRMIHTELTLIPEVFAKYGLIDEITCRSCSTTSLRNALQKDDHLFS